MSLDSERSSPVVLILSTVAVFALMRAITRLRLFLVKKGNHLFGQHHWRSLIHGRNNSSKNKKQEEAGSSSQPPWLVAAAAARSASRPAPGPLTRRSASLRLRATRWCYLQ